MPVKVSVIVPVYNTEKYLRQCIDSLINQTLKDVEFIFVDDGSTDSSLDILEEYKNKDSRIEVLKQQNMFAGVARNNGLKIAKGKYVIFLDSDDFFEKNMLEAAYNSAEKNNSQILIFDYWRYDDTIHKDIPLPFFNFPKATFTHKDLKEKFLIEYIPAPWNKLFLKDFIIENKLEFMAVKKCNDAYFVIMAGALADRMFYLRKRFVHYRVNNNSSLQGSSIDRESYINCAIDIKEGLINNKIYKDSLKNSFIDFACQQVKNGFLKINNLSEDKKYYEFVKKQLIPNLFTSEEDFSENIIINDIYLSANYEDFLFNRFLRLNNSYNQQRENMITKSCIEYKFGKCLFTFPKKIYYFIKKL